MGVRGHAAEGRGERRRCQEGTVGLGTRFLIVLGTDPMLVCLPGVAQELGARRAAAVLHFTKSWICSCPSLVPHSLPVLHGDGGRAVTTTDFSGSWCWFCSG